ncbi:MAG: hypothetical protein HGA22_00640 [Clostridiales bacterium]|nr:hypothetical protein [Clostridiales bacterium]
MGDYRRLPFLLSAMMTFIIGVASYVTEADSKTIYVKMTIAMVVTYIIGIFLKNTLKTLGHEVEERKLEIEKAELEKAENELRMASQNEAAKAGQGDSKINLVAGGDDDEFSPMVLNKVISSKLKE